ncbi:xanthine dehydrogenase, molybdenum binding subunit apoprotein [Glycomyces sambucus]|uniref:Xanthine dehydrogenase, molybdenum binding subunit apoprotein n=1 Tax=Glycomyces sambucus TaxID=380244 RepID=A0A1G9LGL2_9ACTN|nr:molybdopterin cofactor-binding domain-containing protein [Glycomyces sambucus]SDL61092.1 xanthine dehydrogenase, molybdenum binding subunit apoprotein [Glycomyces sambucus]
MPDPATTPGPQDRPVAGPAPGRSDTAARIRDGAPQSEKDASSAPDHDAVRPTRGSGRLIGGTGRVPSGTVGQSPIRPESEAKVNGAFDYASDLAFPDMLWGNTLRSPHPRALIRSIDTAAALALPGVAAVLTAADVPGKLHYGLIEADQPVLAPDQVNYQGEPVAIVAAETLDLARRAADLVTVDYEVLEPRCDADEAAAAGEYFRYQPVRIGDPDTAGAAVVVAREYEVGMQDQAPLGPESGVAVPVEGGLVLHVATQWLHSDLDQIAPCLGLEPERLHLSMAGIGGAFGAREDLSVQIHMAMLAMRTGRPVKMMYDRAESFLGHVHRHPARMRYEHGADADGRLVYVKARIVLDGGAYASTTEAVVGNAASLAVGPYNVEHVSVDAWGARTNNPPCGAMRGFGGVQTCFAYESQMDALADALGLDPREIRRRNALARGDKLITGQVVDAYDPDEAPAGQPFSPLRDLLDRFDGIPVPPVPAGRDIVELPGGTGNTTHGEGVRRGVGYGVGLKNICYSEGFDDYSTAHVRLELGGPEHGGEPVAYLHTAAAEVGQGHWNLQQQIARTELGVEHVVLLPNDTRAGSAGSSSASRQSYMTGGAVKAACEAVRELWRDRDLADGPIEATRVFRHRATKPMDPVTGQGESHVQLALCVHRATVDVDVELGLVKVVDLTCVQDVGKALNPVALEGQIHGGTAQGLGLAVMEEIVTDAGRVRNASFTDYLIPTILDMPPMRLRIVENADPDAPYGLRGAGEPPTLSSTPAIVAAIRDATGLPLARVPVRPEHLTVGRPS